MDSSRSDLLGTALQIHAGYLGGLTPEQWDLPTSIELDLAHAIFDEIRTEADRLRGPGAFGSEVPVDRGAPVLDKLVGVLGRDPSMAARSTEGG